MANTVIPVYLAQLLDKLKAMAPQTTDNIVSKEEGEAAGKGLTPAQSTPKIDYPAAPQRTVLPDTTQFEATPNRSSVALATAGLVAQKNANLEAANEEIAQKAWFEKMKDTSDIYKTDRAIDRQTAAEEARMKRLEAEAQARADLETQKQAGRSELATQRSQAEMERLNRQNALKQELLQATKDLKPDAYSDYKTAFNDYLTTNAIDSANPTEDEIKEAMRIANMKIGKAPKEPSVTKYSGVKENAEAKQAREDLDNANAAKIRNIMGTNKITKTISGSYKKDGKKISAEEAYSTLMTSSGISSPAEFERAWRLINKQ